LPFEGTVDCAVWLTLRSILLESAVYGNIPQNDGITRPITIVAPKGTLANPIFPAPVIARFSPGNPRRHGDEGAGSSGSAPG
jgi:N-methylhydantoinase B